MNPLSATLRRRRDRAFSLIEVMVAAAVLALAITSSIVVIQFCWGQLDRVRTATAASQTMQNEIERLRLLSWADLTALPATAQVDVAAGFSSASIAAGRVTITRNIANITGYDSPVTMKSITLTALWTSLDRQVHTRVHLMRYAKNGLYDYYYSSAQN